MSESEPAGDSSTLPELRQAFSAAGCELMDLDFDLDQSWPLDPNPPSPLLFSLLCSSPSQIAPSPLWAVSDDPPSTEPGLPPLAAAKDATFRPCRSDQIFGNHVQDGDDKNQVPAVLIGHEDSVVSSLIKERMMQALRYFKESTEQHVLVQVWAPVKNGGRYVLTTSGQPFILDPHSDGLLQYRTISLMYMFSVDGESESDLGLPGRVFRQKLPEWTPNVQFYSNKEYCRRNHALHYNVRGSLALPVFEPSGQFCVGVVEIIMTAEKINYALDVDKVCRALKGQRRPVVRV